MDGFKLHSAITYFSLCYHWMCLNFCFFFVSWYSWRYWKFCNRIKKFKQKTKKHKSIIKKKRKYDKLILLANIKFTRTEMLHKKAKVKRPIYQWNILVIGKRKVLKISIFLCIIWFVLNMRHGTFLERLIKWFYFS